MKGKKLNYFHIVIIRIARKIYFFFQNNCFVCKSAGRCKVLIFLSFYLTLKKKKISFWNSGYEGFVAMASLSFFIFLICFSHKSRIYFCYEIKLHHCALSLFLSLTCAPLYFWFFFLSPEIFLFHLIFIRLKENIVSCEFYSFCLLSPLLFSLFIIWLLELGLYLDI